ncbi:MAG: phosphoadenylyl-sulfate reductase [Bacteroidales bacterium]|nr:MAG: phosphoadenylyl-sulfate reductase [Bacteroidales bacterium]
MDNERIRELNDEFRNAGVKEILTYFISEYGNRIVFASSLGAEDQVLTDMITGIDPLVRIISLDTGRLFPETYDLIARTSEKYRINIELFFPDSGKVEDMVNRKGINLFYHSKENRALCCQIRKNDPLKRALKDFDIWICGLRKGQSLHRSDTELVEWDNQHEMIKINPLYNWTSDQVWQYIRKHKIPYNVLHDKGYPSVGCQPCTRAVLPGEGFRSGRWWWEKSDHRECGIHRKPDS